MSSTMSGEWRRVLRSYHTEVDEAADITCVDDYILNENAGPTAR